MRKSVGVAVITHCAKRHLPKCLPPLLQSPLHPRVVVVNSSSNDGTVELAKEMGAETLMLPRSEFNHGTTREYARKYLETDFSVMITPDAYAEDSTLEHLIKPLSEGKAAASYARQIPHDGAGFFEAFPREFNYPEKSHIRSENDISQYGVYSIFFSNSCGAYCNDALDDIGGFKHVLMGEDTFAIAELLHRGHRIAYTADAIVKHSHHYALMEEFKRHFDAGLVRKQFHQLIERYGVDTCRGKEYVKQMIQKICAKKPYLLPYSIAHVGAKWLGYQVGKRSVNAPKWWKRLFSSQDFFWK